MTNPTISENLARVRAGITAAAANAGRDPQGIRLIAVAKTKPASAVVEALAAGQIDFGENYPQEAVAKIQAVAALAPTASPVWHFIGAIQTNKTRDLASHFHWIHTVARTKVARRLNDQCPAGRALNVCLQINVDGDPNKAGVRPEDAARLLGECRNLENLRMRGLMTILDRRTEPEEGYNRLRSLFESLADQAPQGWDTLSMGMSGDYPAAIAAGATLLRIGTAIFGERPGQTDTGMGIGQSG